MRPNVTNYGLTPDALKQIEAKMRQMQATGTVVTPEMMEAMYTAALKTGTDLNKRQADITVTGMREAANDRRYASEVKRQEDAAKAAKNTKMAEGIGGTIGNLGLRYGTKWLDEKLFPAKTPGGSVTGETLKTVGGQPIQESGLQTVGGQNIRIGGQPSLMPEGHPLTGYGSAADMEALELAPSTLPGTGPVTAPPVMPGPLVGPTLETGGAIVPTTELAAMEGAQTAIAPLSPVAELGVNAVAPMGVTEVTGTMIPVTETVMPTVAELGTGAAAPATEIGASALTNAAPALTPMSAMGPFGAGALGAGIMGAFGVDDDVGKALLFGEGGENEQKIAGRAAGGAASGALAGTTIFPGVGTVIGGVLGGIGGAVSGLLDDCIIVTCCHGRHSEQVLIAREYRDRFMSARQIRGYYLLADKLVPLMTRKPKLKNAVRRYLVNRLIPYGRWATGRTTTLPSMTSYVVTMTFLGLCSGIGIYVQQYVRRATGEVY